MARTDPQINIRIPQDLKDKLHESASINGRSVNSDITYRLESSFIGNHSSDDLLTPIEAKAIAKLARDNLYNVLFNQCVIEINAAARSGSVMAFVDVTDTVGEDYYDDDSKICTEVVNPVIDKLKEIGYKVEVDGSGIVINF